LTCPNKLQNIKTVMNKTKLYVYESGEIIGNVKLTNEEMKDKNVLTKVFTKYFGDVVEEEDELEMEVTEGEIMIMINDDMYLCSGKYE